MRIQYLYSIRLKAIRNLIKQFPFRDTQYQLIFFLLEANSNTDIFSDSVEIHRRQVAQRSFFREHPKCTSPVASEPYNAAT